MTALVRILALASLALATAAPAFAQFKVPKKVKEMTGAEKAKPAAAAAGAEGGGTLVLNDDVIGRLIKGMHAAKAYREDAKKANTPYGRYMQAEAAYAKSLELNPQNENAREKLSEIRGG